MRIRLAASEDRDAIEDLFSVAETRFAREAISEHKALRILSSEVIDLVAVADGELVAYGQAAWHDGGRQPHWAFEVVSIAEDEGAAWREMALKLERVVPPSKVRYLWVTRNQDLPGAESAGFSRNRSLYEMRRSLPMDAPPEVGGGSVVIRPFRRGTDEAAWLETHNASFAGHPEVGGMTRGDFEMRAAQTWFDPDGLLLAWSDDRMLGSCWTKLHADRVGEIYLVGVHPDAQGMRLGGELVIAGLVDLADRQGASEAMLYVDGANTRALFLYEQLGFSARSAIHRLEIG